MTQSIDQIFMQATAEIEKTGNPAMIDLARTEESAALLPLIQGAVDPDILVSWSGIGGAGGNCLFATTHTMVMLALSGAVAGWKLVTGTFDHPDTPPITHAWIEHRAPSGQVYVLNVSNAATRPIYIDIRERYAARNNITRRIQVISGEDVLRRARRTQEAGDIDMREFTKRLLNKTRHALAKQEGLK